MSTVEEQREQNVKDFLSSIPASLGFQARQMSPGEYELYSDKCVVHLICERYEESISQVEFRSPNQDNDGMSCWILCLIRSVPITDDEKNSIAAYSRMLVKHFADVLSGDFSVQSEYEELEGRILDRISEVRELPADDPIRIRFENHELQWLFDLENSN